MTSIIWTIAKREFKAYFVSPMAYVYLTAFLVLVHWLFLRSFFLMGEASLRPFFGLMPWVYLFVVPAVAMGKWAEEKKTGTIELLFTYPIAEPEVVAGKFLAGLGLILTALLLTFPLPVTATLVGDVDWGPVIGGYLGLIFLGGAYLAIGLWISSLTENQIIAFIVGVVVCFCLFIVGEPIVTAGLPHTVVTLLQYLGLGSHFESVGRGVLDTRDLIYYCSVIGFFLFLNLKSTAGRRVLITTILIALGTLNLLAARHFARIDLTENKLYTLAPATKGILGGLEDMVTLRLYFSTELPPELLALRRDVQDLLGEFKNHAEGKVHVEFHNPQENAVEEQKVQMMGIPPVEVNVIKKDKQEVAKVYLGMSIGFGAQQEVIPLIQNTGNLEYQLAAGIMKVTQAKRPVLGWWGGEDRGPWTGDQGPEEGRFGLLKNYLGERFTILDIQETSLDQLTPEKIPVLIFPVPEKLSKAEMEAFQKYVTAGGKGLLFIDRFFVGMGEGGILPKPVANPLEEFLAGFGVTVEPDLVVDQSNAMATFTGGFFNYHIPYPFWVQIRPEGFNAEVPFVADLNSLVLPWTSSVNWKEKEGVSAKALFTTTPLAAKTGAL
ncbi:MAG: Gldg family protein, partial [Deltaproteobacteria bacterium]|nr:Gldg family protein [Deltaproteobacteria bacterium]